MNVICPRAHTHVTCTHIHTPAHKSQNDEDKYQNDDVYGKGNPSAHQKKSSFLVTKPFQHQVFMYVRVHPLCIRVYMHTCQHTHMFTCQCDSQAGGARALTKIVRPKGAVAKPLYKREARLYIHEIFVLTYMNAIYRLEVHVSSEN